jgi:hypothetical protein
MPQPPPPPQAAGDGLAKPSERDEEAVAKADSTRSVSLLPHDGQGKVELEAVTDWSRVKTVLQSLQRYS